MEEMGTGRMDVLEQVRYERPPDEDEDEVQMQLRQVHHCESNSKEERENAS